MTTAAITTTRAEHLNWCKARALERVEAGDLDGAFASMGSDLNKHPETAGHPAMELGMLLRVIGFLSSPDQMRRFVTGFH